MARHLFRIVLTCMILALIPIDADAASVKKRMAVMEKKLQQLSRSVSSLRTANKKLKGRLSNVERALAFQTVATFNRSAVLTPSTIHPNDRSTKIALPNAQSPFEGYLWLTVSVTYKQMSGGFLHYAVEPGATASADERCDGFSPSLWGDGVYAFKVYCRLSLSPGEGIAVTAGAFDKGSGWTSAASVSITGNILEIKAP